MLTKKYYLSMLLALVAISVLVSCGDDDEQAASDAWTSVQKNAYITQCTKALPEAQCDCQFNAISEDFTYDEALNPSALAAAKIAQIVLNCAL